MSIGHLLQQCVATNGGARAWANGTRPGGSTSALLSTAVVPKVPQPQDDYSVARPSGRQPDAATGSVRVRSACSFFEVYGGKCFDLLNDREPLRLIDDGSEVKLLSLSTRQPPAPVAHGSMLQCACAHTPFALSS